MGQSGDASAQQPQPQPPAVSEGDDTPMIQEDTSPVAPDAAAIADETTPEDAIEDAETQIVPPLPQTPPPASSKPSAPAAQSAPPAQKPAVAPKRSGAPQLADASPDPQAAAAPPQQGQGAPHVVPVVGGAPNQPQQHLLHQRPPLPGSAIHSPWHTASSWGATTFVITAETAAGFSYLFWWISGLLVYFNERENRYVRFHAVQSILLTGALSVFSVFTFTLAALFNDLFVSTHQHAWQTLSVGTVVASLLIVLLPWLGAMIAAWTGTYLQLPIIGDYAERFAAPPITLRP